MNAKQVKDLRARIHAIEDQVQKNADQIRMSLVLVSLDLMNEYPIMKHLCRRGARRANRARRSHVPNKLG
jgi:hypothetical protein